MSELDQPKGVSRRTVTKAMAWAVPAVALAAPIPAFATSGPPPQVTFGSACKNAGNSCHIPDAKQSYGVPVTVQNGSLLDIWICGVTITAQTPASPIFSPATSVTLPLKVPAGQTANLFFFGQSTASGNILNGSISFAMSWGHAADCSDHDHSPIPVTITWASTPPGCNC
ncbi:hypothetical protein [Microbacterium panaciterrae]|uniref:Uncharacterized protein n=1 Tax=Microbacterium panaciterrae TaxID=985759 RepID=A0ABP8PG38_9MICO